MDLAQLGASLYLDGHYKFSYGATGVCVSNILADKTSSFFLQMH